MGARGVHARARVRGMTRAPGGVSSAFPLMGAQHHTREAQASPFSPSTLDPLPTAKTRRLRGSSVGTGDGSSAILTLGAAIHCETPPSHPLCFASWTALQSRRPLGLGTCWDRRSASHAGRLTRGPGCWPTPAGRRVGARPGETVIAGQRRRPRSLSGWIRSTRPARGRPLAPGPRSRRRRDLPRRWARRRRPRGACHGQPPRNSPTT